MYNILLFVFTIFILSFAVLAVLARDIKYTTSDPDFVSEFNVVHINDGNKKTYPKLGDTVKINFSAKSPHTFKLWYSSIRQPPLPVVVGGSSSMKCWDQILVRMSKGEKLYAVCKAELVYEGRGNDVIPPNSDVGWELEIVGIERKNKKTKAAIDNSKKEEL